MTGDLRVPVIMRAPADPSVVAVARQVATGVALAAGIGETGVHDVKIAVAEACTNVVRHAYPDGLPGELTLAAWVTDRAVMVSVRDRGVGFDVDRGRASGIGLLTVAALAEDVSVRSSERGTEVVMAFPIPGPAG